MSVTVRRASIKDARTIAEFAFKLFAQHERYDERRFSQIADEEQMAAFYGSQTNVRNTAVFIAELEEKIVGFAYVQYETINYAALLKNAAWIHDLYIDEATRGKNAGKLLIEKSIEFAKDSGAKKLMLSVAARNEYAKEFFERQGFRTTMVEMMLDLSL
jgi:ribosomal protein S18 acetylase RimI-like enzyme